MKQTQEVRMKQVKFITGLMAFGVVSLFAGCGEKENEMTKVTLNEVAHSIFYAPQYVALENGYFTQEGLDLDLVTGYGADKTMAAVISGEAQIGFMGAEASVYAYLEGANDPVINFAQGTQRAGNFLVAREEMADFQWSDLKGKEVLGGRKGAMPEMCEVLDRGLERFAELAKRCTGRNLRTIPGGGAAGGVGAAMAVFLGARLVPGSKALLESIGFDGIIAGADIIITGEGHIDRQTLDGKLPYGVLQRGRAKGIPVIAVAGRVSDAEMLLENGFTAVLPAVDEDADLVEAMKPENASANIRRAVAKYFANN